MGILRNEAADVLAKQAEEEEKRGGRRRKGGHPEGGEQTAMLLPAMWRNQIISCSGAGMLEDKRCKGKREEGVGQRERDEMG